MSLVSEKITLSSQNSFITDNWLKLETIKNSAFNIGILSRKEDIEIENFLEKLIEVFEGEKASEGVSFNQINLDFISNFKYLNPQGFKNLSEDISLVAKKFSSLTKCSSLNFYFGIINQVKCPVFHCDNNHLRLVCTYLGQGTLWLENNNVIFDKLGCGDNQQIVINPLKIKQVNPFEVAILKGRKFDKNSKPVVHRSPDLELSMKKRVLLRLDIV